MAATATGGNNVALGYQALISNTSGTSNTALGRQAGYALAAGLQNTAVGANAMDSGDASYSVAVGYTALSANSGSYNVAVGNAALKSNTTASDNTAVGYQAGYSNTTGTTNTFLGYQSGYAVTTSGDGTYLGWQAGADVTTGANNVCVGSFAGRYTTGIVTGGQNIMIGAYTGSASTSANYQIVIGYGAISKGAGTGYINPGSGGVYQGNNSSTWLQTSDQRLKKNIVSNNTGLDVINAIQVRNFEYRLPEEITELDSNCAVDVKGVQLGAIAQEIQTVLPDCVKEESTGVLRVDTDNLTWYLINAVKELKAEIDQLKAK